MERKMTWKRLWRGLWPWLPAALWYAVIFRFSAQTGGESSALSDRLALGLLEGSRPGFSLLEELDLFAWMTFILRKGAHMGAFFLLTGLLFFALRPLGQRGLRRWLALGLCALLAGLDELHQRFVPGRSGQLRDVFIDLVGACLFLVFWALLSHIAGKRREKQGKTPEKP